MSVSEYRDRFTQLSRYAPEEVDTDEKCQERFLEGLIESLNYQLQSHSFPNFKTLLNKAIGLESKRRELSDLSAFRDRGSLGPMSECRRVPQPRWVEREGEREGGEKQGGRRPA
jgi:hypothetical protein